MAVDELEVLARAHGLFAGAAVMPGNGAVTEVRSGFSAPPGVMATAYRRAAAQRSAEAAAVLRIDDDLIRILASAVREHGRSRLATAAVLAAARADGDWPDSPIAAREALRRKALRLRAQRRHVLEARRRAHRGRAELLALRYPGRSRRRGGGADRRIERVVRAALSRLGCPYVWGATGPDRFDCSGLVKWAYAQAGIALPRTTYDQINEGVPIPRGQVRAGDLVFPHTGHVQMAIGPDTVIEAPYAGAVVRIGPLGSHVAIRRVL